MSGTSTNAGVQSNSAYDQKYGNLWTIVGSAYDQEKDKITFPQDGVKAKGMLRDTDIEFVISKVEKNTSRDNTKLAAQRAKMVREAKRNDNDGQVIS